MAKYTVVQFLVDHSVAVVATNWLNESDGKLTCVSIRVESLEMPENWFSHVPHTMRPGKHLNAETYTCLAQVCIFKHFGKYVNS